MKKKLQTVVKVDGKVVASAPSFSADERRAEIARHPGKVVTFEKVSE